MPRLCLRAARLASVVAAWGSVAAAGSSRGLSPAAGRADEWPALAGTVRVAGRAARDAVLWLDAPAARAYSPSATATLDQRNMQFVPRVLAVRVGTTVRMPNSDRLLHNVFSFHDGKVFDLGLYPMGASRSVTFDEPGLSRVFCNIHPTMAAYVVAVDSPYFAVTDAGGGFVLQGVPPGRHTYHLWRASAPSTNGSLDHVPGQLVTLALP